MMNRSIETYFQVYNELNNMRAALEALEAALEKFEVVQLNFVPTYPGH